MTKVEGFNRGIEKLKSLDYFHGTDMSDMGNWCMVHATKYMPLKRPDGTMYIPSTAMATNFKIPRTTVHVTLNHVVTGHLGGNWDDMPIIILAPYTDVVEQNGNPAEVAGTDTYWSVNPDTGLVLPKSTYIIQPDDNGPLFQIGEHGATYKRDNYTDDEIKQIESLLDSYDLAEYEKYKNGDLKEYEIQDEFRKDERVEKMYESAKDKKAFLRGLFEENRFNILSQYLRDAVVKLSMQKIGKQWVNDISDGSRQSEIIEHTAKSKGLFAVGSNKGHSNSVYASIEERSIKGVYYGGVVYTNFKILETTDVNTIYNVISERPSDLFYSSLVAFITDNRPIDFAKMYQDIYASNMQDKIDFITRNIEYDTTQLNEYENNEYPYLEESEKNRHIQNLKNRISENGEYIKKWSGKDTIADYDKNLAETIRRHCEYLTTEYNAWREKLVKEPGYEELVQKLRALIATQSVARGGRDDF